MKILICTGIYPPDIGGPATQAKVLFEELPKYQCQAKVVTYGDPATGGLESGSIFYISRRQNILFRYLKYFWKVFCLSKEADIIYAFDLISVGLPCAVAKILRPRAKLFVRLGGDYQWERATQTREYAKTLEQYYIDSKFSPSEKLIYFITNFVIGRASRIIFNARLLKDIYVKYRGLSEDQTAVIGNIKQDIIIKTKPATKDYINILFAGRLIAARNLKNLIGAFALINKNVFPKKIELEIIGNGPEKNGLEAEIGSLGMGDGVKIFPQLGRDELLEKINNSDLVALVSLTEINSNFMMEALSLGKVVILTEKSEPCYVGYKNALIYYVNPFDKLDIAEKVELALGDLLSGRINGTQGGLSGEEEEKIYLSADQNIKSHLKIFNA